VTADRTVAVVGAFEHPTRYAPDKSDFQLLQECAAGALHDAGLSPSDVDGLCTLATANWGGDLSDPGPNRMADYLNVDPVFVDTTYVGGASVQFQVRRAAMAIRAGLSKVVLIMYGARPRSNQRTQGVAAGTAVLASRGVSALRATAESFEDIYGVTTLGTFAMMAARHMHLYGTTEEQLADVSVAVRSHAALNPQARYRDLLAVEDVLGSRMVSSPLRILNCCVITDGGGALVLAGADVARNVRKPPVWLIGSGEALTRGDGGYGDWLDTGLRRAARTAFDEAGVKHADVDTVQIYDATAFHVIQHLEDLGFCEIGQGGAFVAGGSRIRLGGELPVNTDGGGLSSNHVITRGIFVVIEAVRQLRRECADRQVNEARVAIASAVGGGGPGGQAYRRSASALILARD